MLLPIVLLSCGRSSSSRSVDEGSAGAAEQGGTTGAGGGTGGNSGNAGSGSNAGADSSGGSAGASGASSVTLDGSPIYTRVQRLTVTQWRNSVRDILRLEDAGTLGEGFRVPAPGEAEFTNNEKLLYVDVRDAREFEAGSEAAAALATGSAAALARLYSGTDPAGFVSELGRRAFRRPLSEAEQTKYERTFALGEELYGAGFEHGAAFVIRAMLVSPHFLYRSELGPSGEPLGGYEIASKLSFFLLATTPSDELLDAAAAGELDSAEGVVDVARGMLEQPGAVEVMRDFHAQAFRLSRFGTLTKPDVPDFDGSLGAELATVSSLFFDGVFASGGGLREILTSRRAFVGPALAPFYGVDPPDAIEELTLDSERTGYFLQVPFLLLFSAGEEPGTIGRGVALNTEVLCNETNPLHDSIPSIPEQPDQTNRERIEMLTAGTGCSGCHGTLINPLGFAFEAFDGLGRKRDLDGGRPVDTSGSYPFSDGSRDFADAKELVEIMADTAQAHTCYAKNVAGYALQRDMSEADRPLLESLADVSREESAKELVISLVRDPAFRLRAEEP